MLVDTIGKYLLTTYIYLICDIVIIATIVHIIHKNTINHIRVMPRLILILTYIFHFHL